MKNLLLVTLSVGVALALGEMAARIVLPPPNSRMPLVRDSIIGYRHSPNQKTWWTNTRREFGVWFTTNSHGDPDVERSFTKRSYRIAVIGDSMVEAAQVADSCRFTSILEDSLGVEVLNFGIQGHGTKQEWLNYQHHVRRFDPDLVLLVFTPANDFEDNMQNIRMLEQKPRSIIRQSRLLRAARDLMVQPPAVKEERRAGGSGRAVAVTDSLLRGFAAGVQQDGRKFFVLAASPDPRLGEVLDGISHVVFRPRKGDNFVHDGHWTEQGHRAVAKLLLSVLKES